MTVNHESPDGKYRPCSNPANCRFGTPLENHVDNAEASRRNEQLLAQQYENTDTLNSGSSAPKEARDKEGRLTVRSDLLPAGFDSATAEPEQFDTVTANINNITYERYVQKMEVLSKVSRYRTELNISNGGRYVSPETAEQKLRNYTGDNQNVLYYKEQLAEIDGELSRYVAVERKLDKVYRQRGAWPRAYLAVTSTNSGHVHKTMHCSTCNKNGTRTQFSWQTEYSGKDEATIVKDAGYRACTVCYPDAPVGNEKSLPTRMFSEDEKRKQAERIERELKRAQKQSEAVTKAPTRDGSPLKVNGETFKTERTALTYIADSASKAMERNHNKVNPESHWSKTVDGYEDTMRTIIRSLADKHDVTVGDMVKQVLPNVEKKIARMNKEVAKFSGDKRYPYDPDYMFGFTQEELNQKPAL